MTDKLPLDPEPYVGYWSRHPVTERIPTDSFSPRAEYSQNEEDYR